MPSCLCCAQNRTLPFLASCEPVGWNLKEGMRLQPSNSHFRDVMSTCPSSLWEAHLDALRSPEKVQAETEVWDYKRRVEGTDILYYDIFRTCMRPLRF